jgi:hypothetical protein
MKRTKTKMRVVTRSDRLKGFDGAAVLLDKKDLGNVCMVIYNEKPCAVTTRSHPG